MTGDNDIKPDESLLEPLKENVSKLAKAEKWQEEEVLALATNDNFLCQCLLARFNDLKKATTLAGVALRWREKVKPSKLTVADFPIANSQKMFSFAGYTKNGWPVIHCKSKNWNPWAYSVDEYIKAVAFVFEQAQRGMDPSDPYARIFVIMDMKGISKLNSDFGKLRQLVKIACDYYPERLGFGVLCNADFVTWLLWNFVSPLMDPRNRVRIMPFRSDFHDFLEEHVGMENIGPALGGSRAEEWPTITVENQNDLKWSERNCKRQETMESDNSELPESAKP